MQFDPATDFKLLLAVPLIPLIGYVVNIFFGRRLPRGGDWLLTGGMFVVMCITVYMFFAKAWATSEVRRAGEPPAVLQRIGQDRRSAPVFKLLLPDSADRARRTSSPGSCTTALGADDAARRRRRVVPACTCSPAAGTCTGTKRYHIFFANISLFTFAMLAPGALGQRPVRVRVLGADGPDELPAHRSLQPRPDTAPDHCRRPRPARRRS